MSEPKKVIPFGRPWITEEDKQAVLKVLNGPILTHGPVCHEFEDAFAGYMKGGKAVSVSSCTAGLHLYYMHLKLGVGDEVIMPAMSHVATVHALEVTGAKPVFVDGDDQTCNMDPKLVERAITPATKAIAPVHYLGFPADMPALMKIAKKHQLKVLEDCAVGLGTLIDGTNVGLFGDASAFSFYPAKHITTAEGGMFLGLDPKVVDSVKKIRGFSYDKTLNERTIPGIYDVDGLGLNYRMSELQAALGLSQLTRLDQILAMRKRNFQNLQRGLQGISQIRILDCAKPGHEQSYYLMSVVILGKQATKRNDVLLKLQERGVGTGVHYPHPLPRLKYYRNKYGYQPGAYPNAEQIADNSFNLPLGPHIDDDAVSYIVDNVKAVLKEI